MVMLDQNFLTIIAALYAIFAFITIIFSSTVIFIIVSYWKTNCRSTANLFTCHSSAALLFYAINLSIQIPFVIQSDPLHPDEMNTTFCKIRSFIATFATLVKAYSYLVMAISCFFITILYKHRILLSFRVNWIIIISSWIFSGIVTFGTFLSPSAYEYEVESGLCFLTTKKFATSFTVVTLVVVITLGVMITLYGIIIWNITRYNRINPNSRSTLRAKRNMKVYRKIFLFVFILLVGGTPYLICSILHEIGIAPWSLYAIVQIFIVFSAALESMALLFTNEQVRTILFARLRCREVNPSNSRAIMTINRTIRIMPYPITRYRIQSLTIIN